MSMIRLTLIALTFALFAAFPTTDFGREAHAQVTGAGGGAVLSTGARQSANSRRPGAQSRNPIRLESQYIGTGTYLAAIVAANQQSREVRLGYDWYEVLDGESLIITAERDMTLLIEGEGRQTVAEGEQFTLEGPATFRISRDFDPEAFLLAVIVVLGAFLILVVIGWLAVRP